MTLYLACITAAILGAVLVEPAAADIDLVSRGKTNYSIVMPEKPTPVDKTAANQLSTYLNKSTGADFEIIKENLYNAEKPAILLGNTKRTGKYLTGFKYDSLGRDGIIIKTFNKDIVLTGGEPAGILNAVVTFLEEQVGVRWWTATEEDVPQHKTLKIKKLNTVFVPKLQIRHNWSMEMEAMQPYTGPEVSDEQSDIFSIHLKNNGKGGMTNNYLPDELGGSNTIFGAHTVPLTFLKAEQYFGKHPDWYGLVKGERIAHQVCWTNKEMRKQLIENVLQFLREHPKVTVVSVSQNDGGNPCECPECTAIVQNEETQMGPILDGVNAVADAVAKEFPNVLVESLSYYYSQKCPKNMKAKDNVLVRICTYEQTMNKPLTESDYNKDNRDNLLEWGEHAKNLFVWNYVTDFAHYMYPQPNLFALAPNLRFFIEHNVKGVFMQGDVHCQTGDFQHLRAWFVSQLLWNPYQDDKRLIKEFCDGYYGKAGRYVYDWIDTMCNAAYASPNFIGIYNGDLSFLTLDAMNKGYDLWNKAESAVKEDPVKARRVKRARLSFDLASIVSRERLTEEAKVAGITYTDTKDISKCVSDLLDAIKSYGTTHVSEVGGEIPLFESSLKTRFIPPDDSILIKSDRVEIQSLDFRLKESPLCKLIDDPTASDGKAVMTAGNHVEWSISCAIKPEYYGKWRCKSYIRLDASSTSGTGLQLGIYDSVESREVMVTTQLPAAKCGTKEYAEIDMGVYDLKSGMYVWFAPINDPANVQAIYVDRLVLERMP